MEDSGRPHPTPPDCFKERGGELPHPGSSLSRSRPTARSDLYDLVCHTAAASMSCCFSPPPHALFTCWCFSKWSWGGRGGPLGLYCPHSTKTVPVKSDPLPLFFFNRDLLREQRRRMSRGIYFRNLPPTVEKVLRKRWSRTRGKKLFSLIGPCGLLPCHAAAQPMRVQRRMCLFTPARCRRPN